LPITKKAKTFFHKHLKTRGVGKNKNDFRKVLAINTLARNTKVPYIL
jgi:hypothetical protein